MKKILVLNGPNINMLGIREPEVYGTQTYEDLLTYLSEAADELNVRLTCVQSNHEGELVTEIQRAYREKYDGIVINPAAYTHTSIAIPDAIRAVSIPAVEVHLSDITKREEYRKISYTSEACVKTVMGKGFEGYKEAIGILTGVSE
jgi:3-dehydroquinate dehydratase-2